MRWRPRPGWVIVEPIETEETFSGGSIVIPVQARDRTALWQYTVVECVPGEVGEEPETPSPLQPGDWVMTRPRAAFEIEEEKVWLVAEKDCWAVIA